MTAQHNMAALIVESGAQPISIETHEFSQIALNLPSRLASERLQCAFGKYLLRYCEAQKSAADQPA